MGAPAESCGKRVKWPWREFPAWALYKMQTGSLVSSMVEEKKVTDLTRLLTQSMEKAFNCCERCLEKKKKKRSEKLLMSRCTIFRNSQGAVINHFLKLWNCMDLKMRQPLFYAFQAQKQKLGLMTIWENIPFVWPQICTKYHMEMFFFFNSW